MQMEARIDWLRRCHGLKEDKEGVKGCTLFGFVEPPKGSSKGRDLRKRVDCRRLGQNSAAHNICELQNSGTEIARKASCMMNDIGLCAVLVTARAALWRHK